jgi:hypothetical protein
MSFPIYLRFSAVFFAIALPFFFFGYNFLYKNRIFTAFRRENARTVHKEIGLVDGH